MGMMPNIFRSTNSLIRVSVLTGTVCFCVSTYSTASSNKSSFSTSFSEDVASISMVKNSERVSIQQKRPNIDVRFGTLISEQKVGKFLYKAFENPNKFAEQAAVTTIFTGLESMGFSEPVKQSIYFIKRKTRFKFGKCGKFRLSSKVRAESCLSDTSSVEIQSNYKMDSMLLNFKWAL